MYVTKESFYSKQPAFHDVYLTAPSYDVITQAALCGSGRPMCLAVGPGAGIQLSATNKYHPNRILFAGKRNDPRLMAMPRSRHTAASSSLGAQGVYLHANSFTYDVLTEND